MADKPKLNEALTAGIDEYIKRGGWDTKRTKWSWQDSRQILWFAVRDEVLEEYRTALGDAVNQEKFKAAEKTALLAARKAFNSIVDDGYCIESSNLGKHLLGNGYMAEAPKGGAVGGEPMV